MRLSEIYINALLLLDPTWSQSQCCAFATVPRVTSKEWTPPAVLFCSGWTIPGPVHGFLEVTPASRAASFGRTVAGRWASLPMQQLPKARLTICHDRRLPVMPLLCQVGATWRNAQRHCMSGVHNMVACIIAVPGRACCAASDSTGEDVQNLRGLPLRAVSTVSVPMRRSDPAPSSHLWTVMTVFRP